MTGDVMNEKTQEFLKQTGNLCLAKPFSMDELLLIVKRLVKMLELEDENRSLREELEGRFSFKGMLGKNDKMREVLEKIKLVAPTDSRPRSLFKTSERSMPTSTSTSTGSLTARW